MIEYTVRVYEDRTEWFLNDQRHREDGPAIEFTNGDKFWYLNGKRHREDGPAIEYRDGYKAWWINGMRHREDGPALEHANGYKYWYLNDEQLTEEKFNLKTQPTKELTMEEVNKLLGFKAKIIE